jgi:tetratricopeptide (TPR) repeat protein
VNVTTKTLVAIAAIVLWCTCSPVAASDEILDARILAAYRAAYDLDHQAALRIARAVVADSPDESRAHRTLAGILWLQALFHRGAVTVDHYMGGLTTSRADLPEPPQAIEAEYRTSIARAIALGEARLEERPGDPDALNDVGSAYGLEASWTASVEGRVRAAFGAARRAFTIQERVLDIDPARVGAGTIVGTYRYAVSGFGPVTRMMAYLAGFGGGKARGIALLEAATAPHSESRFEARTALVLIYSREGRHDDAFRLLTSMSAEFPQNRILVLERGAAALRAGRAREAEAIISAGMTNLDADTRRRLPGERALWSYRRALARLALNRPTDAAADLRFALGAGPEPWIGGRIELALGQAADLESDRAEALVHYRRARQIARETRDPVTLAEANRRLRRPFTLAHTFTPLRQEGDAPACVLSQALGWHGVERRLV